MNTMELWWPTFGLLALEGTLMIAGAIGLARGLSSAFWRTTGQVRCDRRFWMRTQRRMLAERT